MKKIAKKSLKKVAAPKKKKLQPENLAKMLTFIKTEDQGMKVLKDLFTPSEIKTFLQRLELINQIIDKQPHRKISKSLKLSISKVTRGSQAFKKSKGGFRLLLKK
jgi:Trp operon repressor